MAIGVDLDMQQFKEKYILDESISVWSSLGSKIAHGAGWAYLSDMSDSGEASLYLQGSFRLPHC